MSDEDETGPGPENWKKSQQIRRALGLPFTSIFGAVQLVKGWKAGTFTADNLQDVFEMLVYVGLMIYAPLHAGIIWIRKRVAAGNDPKSNASVIVPPVVVTAAIRLSQDIGITKPKE